eukprot:TRINITY_DN1255_c0_g1_i1.p1 TRINITY_DN1255_c0_g1~~TRINITY_DN1255_c0_g1_i1.p1  ORF type:complete len:336 (-),score=91.77 TRINITY_DN1255_c0_g1_i1:31-1038(-)
MAQAQTGGCIHAAKAAEQEKQAQAGGCVHAAKAAEQETKQESSAACPFEEPPKSGIDIAAVDENPTMIEYRKIRRTQGIVTQFYKDGTNLKKEHYDTVTEEIKKLDTDVEMLDGQVKALDDPKFANHPKQKAFKRELAAERENLLQQRETLVARQTEYKGLMEWSQKIVEVCEWLEIALDDYCCSTIGLPLRKDVKPAPELTPEQKEAYSNGLDEIHHNLEESQDFFAASVDGRLHSYHSIEKEIVEALLKVVRSYPESSPRRGAVEPELVQDLEFVESNMVVSDDGQKRREKMMAAHADFFKVLDYFKVKLGYLPISNPKQKTYDPKFDLWFDG